MRATFSQTIRRKVFASATAWNSFDHFEMMPGWHALERAVEGYANQCVARVIGEASHTENRVIPEMQ